MYLYEHEDFTTFLQQTETRTGVPVEFIEKDYWVSYVLYRLVKTGVTDFVFKGGTSLTKALNLLERFSEDIDLLFLKNGRSRNQCDRRLTEIRDLVGTFNGITFDPGNSLGQGSYQISRYNYPIQTSASGVLLPYIKLDMGYRGGSAPASERQIQSYVGKALSNLGQEGLAEDIPAFNVRVLDPTRTFVEKLFILYSAFEQGKVTANVRHYYDIHKLLELAQVRDFLGTPEHQELKQDIARMSSNFQNTILPEGLDFSFSRAFRRGDQLEQELEAAFRLNETLFFGQRPNPQEILDRCERFLPRF